MHQVNLSAYFSRIKVKGFSFYERLVGMPPVSESEISEELMRKCIAKEDPVIFDIGCNDGFNTLWFFKIFRDPKVYCFEPDPRAITRFKQNVDRNPNISLAEIALCENDGEIDFYQSGGYLDEEMYHTMPAGWDLSGSIRQPKNHLISNKWVTFNQQIKVKASTLDSWCNANQIEFIDFIWMDVQGAEIDVLKGGMSTLRKTRFIYTEYSNNELYKGQYNLRRLMRYLNNFEVIVRFSGDVLLANKHLLGKPDDSVQGNRFKKIIKRYIGRSAIYKYRINRIEYRHGKSEYAEWLKIGEHIPLPHLLKQNILQDYANNYALEVFVETGTFSGRMVEAMRKKFDQIYSIELCYDLYLKAKERFRNFKNIEIIWGNSGFELLKIMDNINKPCLFWLDGHYSGEGTAKGAKETPIIEELECLLNQYHFRHVILIDDARLFGNVPDYPSIDELSQYVKSKKNDMDFAVDKDIIRITPRV